MISAFYQDKLSSLNVDRSSGHLKPHKVCLLLAVIDLIRNNKKTKNEFTINDELKNSFSFHFNHLRKNNDADNIIQPFYHLHTDDIWHFKIKSGKRTEFDIVNAKKGTLSIKTLFDVIDYAYLDNDLFDYLQNEISRRVAIETLLENLEDLSVQFHWWLISMGKSKKTADSYVGAISGTISNWVFDAGISQQPIISIQSFSKINTISEQLVKYDVFVNKNAKGNGMYSAALNSYKSFLAITCQSNVTEDIENIIKDKSIDDTKKLLLVTTRVGQGKFRESLIKYWKGCAITGYSATQFLVASHIKPWKSANGNERLDPYNGLLLLPNLEKAFDLGYISFTEKGTIRISEFIEKPDVLCIREDMKIKLVTQHQDYLAYHRECVYEQKL